MRKSPLAVLFAAVLVDIAYLAVLSVIGVAVTSRRLRLLLLK